MINICAVRVPEEERDQGGRNIWRDSGEIVPNRNK